MVFRIEEDEENGLNTCSSTHSVHLENLSVKPNRHLHVSIYICSTIGLLQDQLKIFSNIFSKMISAKGVGHISKHVRSRGKPCNN